jgi:hypothetical protein
MSIPLPEDLKKCIVMAVRYKMLKLDRHQESGGTWWRESGQTPTSVIGARIRRLL